MDYLGYVAAFLTTGSFLPQVIHALRTRDLSGISLSMYLMFVSGVACWVGYGFVLGSLPVIVCNIVTLLLASIILGLKVREVMNSRPAAKYP